MKKELRELEIARKELHVLRYNCQSDRALISKYIKLRAKVYSDVYGDTNYNSEMDQFDLQPGTIFIVMTVDGEIVGGERLIIRQQYQNQKLPIESRGDLGYIGEFITHQCLKGKTIIEPSGLVVSRECAGKNYGATIVRKGNEVIEKEFPRHVQLVENAPASVKLFNMNKSGVGFTDFDLSEVSVSNGTKIPLSVRVASDDNSHSSLLRARANNYKAVIGGDPSSQTLATSSQRVEGSRKRDRSETQISS